MKKNILTIFILICSAFVFQNVNAKEIVYKNELGLELTEMEYQNILAIHGEDYLKTMSSSDFDKYKEYYSYPDLKIEKVNSNVEEFIMPLSEFYETNYKRLSVTNVTNSTPTTLVVVQLKWKQVPKVKSYDVIGVRLYNTSFSGSVSTYALINGIRVSPEATKKVSNGVGASIKLLSDSSSIEIQQSFTVNSGGIVYACYQHAIKNISLSDSQNFTISSVGLGKVFKFTNISLFDQMDGISIKI